eukprot:TRINITY_DN10532_c0_g1_i2.p2 TRINITY_DN10532_c0_g1~~TRINITY_DN10532_c0_g1_i2.p2  ORF type:complete len:190 (+),score=35.21 TRINITY_DN10532_c0_g1_i2:66-572(+)
MEYKDEVTIAAVCTQLQDETRQFLDKHSELKRLARIPSLDLFQEAVIPIPWQHPLYEPLQMAAKIHCIYGLIKEFERGRVNMGSDWELQKDESAAQSLQYQTEEFEFQFPKCEQQESSDKEEEDNERSMKRLFPSEVETSNKRSKRESSSCSKLEDNIPNAMPICCTE